MFIKRIEQEAARAASPRRFRAVVWSALVTGLAATPMYGQCFHQQKLVGQEYTGFEQSGFSVAQAENTIIVGAPRTNCDAGNACGAAYVFNFDGTNWVEGPTLTAPDGAVWDVFGSAVAMDEDTAVVGAPGVGCSNGLSCGAIYVFRRGANGWEFDEKLYAPDGAPGAKFGNTVSVSGNIIVAGAPNADRFEGQDFGAAYAFRFNGAAWIPKPLTAAETEASDLFGTSVSVDGTTAIVGAPARACMGVLYSGCGAAYIFEFNGTSWDEKQTLVSAPGDPPGDPSGALYDLFGTAVSLNDGVAVVGASQVDCSIEHRACGAAFVFRFDGADWAFEDKLNASDGEGYDSFGGAVSVNGDTIVVGAENDDCDDGVDCGAAYVFKLKGSAWVQNRKLTSLERLQAARYGMSVSVLGETVVLGSAFGADDVFRCYGCRYLDADGDGDVDMADFAVALECFTGPAN